MSSTSNKKSKKKQIQFEDFVEVFHSPSDNNSTAHTKTRVDVKDYDAQRKNNVHFVRERRAGIRRTRQPQSRQRQQKRKLSRKVIARAAAKTAVASPCQEDDTKRKSSTEKEHSSRWKTRRDRKASMFQSRLAKDRFAAERSSTSNKKRIATALSWKYGKTTLSASSDVAPQVPKRSTFVDDNEDDDPVTSDTCEGFSSGYSSAEEHVSASSYKDDRPKLGIMGSLARQPGKLAKQPARLAKSARRRLRIRAEKRRQELLENKIPGHVEIGKDGNSIDDGADDDDSIDDGHAFDPSLMLNIGVHHERIRTDEVMEITLSTSSRPEYSLRRQRSVGIDDILEPYGDDDETVEDVIIRQDPGEDPSDAMPRDAPSTAGRTIDNDDFATGFYTTLSSMSGILADTWADSDLFASACVGMSSLADCRRDCCANSHPSAIRFFVCYSKC
ncbi:MAG: hypothetical protein SGILL_001405 [Bacillariaceae sp.]